MNENSNKWWILIAMCLLTAVLNIDIAGMNVAIPTIAREFHANLANMQWIINIYVLMGAAFQILGGKLGDVYGHKKIYLIGCASFVLGSLGAGLSTNEGFLIAFRTIQGISLGIGYPMTIVLTLAAFPKNQQAFAIGLIMTTMGVCLSLGPILGGIFIQFLTWRWIFYINIPIGILSFILAYMFCNPHEEKEKKHIDYRGALFLVLGLVGIIVALNQVQIWGLASLKFWLILALGFLSLLILYLVSQSKSDPIIEFKLFKTKNFTLNNILRIFMQIVFVPILFFIPIYLQNIVGYSPLNSGLMMLFLTITIAIFSPITGKWIDKIGDRLPNILAMLLFTGACFLLIFIKPTPNLILFSAALILTGLGTAINSLSTVVGSVTPSPPEQQGVATGLILTSAWFGCALGISIMGSILTISGDAYFNEQIKSLGIILSDNQQALTERVISGVSSFKSLASSFTAKQLNVVTSLSKKSFIHGFKISMIAFMTTSLIGFVLGLFLDKLKPKQEPTK